MLINFVDFLSNRTNSEFFHQSSSCNNYLHVVSGHITLADMRVKKWPCYENLAACYTKNCSHSIVDVRCNKTTKMKDNFHTLTNTLDPYCKKIDGGAPGV